MIAAVIRSSLTLLRQLCAAIPQALLKPLLSPVYWFTCRAAVKVWSRLPGVRAVYLSGSGAEGHLRYGVSDLDFLIVLDSGAEAEQNRKDLRSVTAKLRKVLPVLQPANEVAVFTAEELRSYVSIDLPHILSIRERLKPLWIRGSFDIFIPYRKEHELSLLSACWRKWICLKASGRSCAHAAHQSRRLSQIIAGCERRLGVSGNGSSISERIDAAVRVACNIFLFDTAKNEPPATIFNTLYIENFPLYNFFVHEQKPASKLRIASIALDEIQGDEPFDFAFHRGLLYPVRTELHPFIVNPLQNPVTYQQLSLPAMESGQVEELLIRGEGADSHGRKIGNLMWLDRYRGSPEIKAFSPDTAELWSWTVNRLEHRLAVVQNVAKSGGYIRSTARGV